MSLSTRLQLVIATCLLPTLLLQLDGARRQWSERRAQLDALTIQQAQLLSGNIAGMTRGARMLLGAAAEFTQVRHQGEQCGARLASLRAHAPAYAFVALLDAEGRVVCASDERLLGEAPGASWVRGAASAQAFGAGRFARPVGFPQGVLPFQLPLPATADAEQATLVAGLDLDWLNGHLAQIKATGNAFLASGVLTVADADGVIAARDVRHADFVGQRFPPAALPLLAATQPTVLRMRSIDGTDRLVGYAPTGDGIVSVVGLHEPELMGDLADALRRGAILLALVSLLAVGLTLLVARRFITRPTQALLTVAHRWSRGELEARAPACGGRRSEFGRLGAAYNEMAAALQQREGQLRGQAEALEAAVSERTRALSRANARLEAEIREHRSTGAALLQAQKVQAVGQLAGGIAHDFNNVLQAVTGGISLIRARSGDPAMVERLAAMIEDSARRGESVTRRLLAFSRREELRAEPLDLAGLLDGIGEVLGATIGPNIRVKVGAPPGLPPVLADRGQLETVLLNLCTNARDAMPEGGCLSLSAAGPAPLPGRPGQFLCLRVADTGEGMDAATLERAAEPFFTTKPMGRGTGLGLAMARRFAQDSRGEMLIESVPGTGTTVALWLPLAVAAAEAAPAAKAPQARAAAILLVDDEPAVREVLAAHLEDAGHVVTQAGDAEAALRLAEAGERFDLLLTDLAMPGMDGISLIAAMRGRQPSLRALLVTGFAGDAATLAFKEGGGHLLRKPVSGAALNRQVAEVLHVAVPADGALLGASR